MRVLAGRLTIIMNLSYARTQLSSVGSIGMQKTLVWTSIKALFLKPSALSIPAPNGKKCQINTFLGGEKGGVSSDTRRLEKPRDRFERKSSEIVGG